MKRYAMSFILRVLRKIRLYCRLAHEEYTLIVEHKQNTSDM